MRLLQRTGYRISVFIGGKVADYAERLISKTLRKYEKNPHLYTNEHWSRIYTEIKKLRNTVAGFRSEIQKDGDRYED